MYLNGGFERSFSVILGFSMSPENMSAVGFQKSPMLLFSILFKINDKIQKISHPNMINFKIVHKSDSFLNKFQI